MYSENQVAGFPQPRQHWSSHIQWTAFARGTGRCSSSRSLFSSWATEEHIDVEACDRGGHRHRGVRGHQQKLEKEQTCNRLK